MSESYRFSVECGICHRYSTFDHDPVTWKCQQGNCRAEHDVYEGVMSVRRQSYEPVPTIPKERYRMRCPECGTYTDSADYQPHCWRCGNDLPAPGAGRKLDQNKPRYDLLPHLAMKATARILAFGAGKYAEDNWRIVPQRKKRYYRAAIGHLMDWWASGGRERDAETGESHLAHALCCIMFLLDEEEAERLTSVSEPR